MCALYLWCAPLTLASTSSLLFSQCCCYNSTVQSNSQCQQSFPCYSMFDLAGTGGEWDPLCPLMTIVPILRYEQFRFPCRIYVYGPCSNWLKLFFAHPQNSQNFNNNNKKYCYYQQDFHWLWTLGRVIIELPCPFVCLYVCLSVCAIVKHPLPVVLDTSGRRTYC